MNPNAGWSARLAGLFVVILVLGISSYWLARAGCENPEEAVATARGLSTERLREIYHRCEQLQQEPQTLYVRKHKGKQASGLPEGFQDLGVDRILVSKRKVEIRLCWCVDSGVSLNVFTKGERAPSVVLSWDQPLQSQELWSETRPATALMP